MSTLTRNLLRKGLYQDSVALMRASRTLAAAPRVEDAALMMTTPANKAILREAGLLTAEGAAGGPGDLVVAVRAHDQAALDEAMSLADGLLDAPEQSRSGAIARPRSLAGALRIDPRANLALISVPGLFAAAEARAALRRGLHVFLFSDNVPLEEEIALKCEARERGLLVMGPDCGTAIIGGLALGFANRVPRGDVGLIGASGTGLQEISSLLAHGGAGISNAIGVGGRDLHREVGAISTFMALEALDRDPGTECIVLVSKPPAPEVIERVIARLAGSAKRFVLCLLGARGGIALPANATLAPTLAEAARQVLRIEGAAPATDARARAVRGPLVRGLYTGGSLCAEAQVVLLAAGEPVYSNAPVPDARPQACPDAHGLIDLGADEFTVGTPHPMIDPAGRAAALSAAAREPRVGVLLLDVVLGLGAHPDPAGVLASQLDALDLGGMAVVASVTGTDEDPQGRTRQVATLEAAGVLVAPSNAEAARLALACVQRTRAARP